MKSVLTNLIWNYITKLS